MTQFSERQVTSPEFRNLISGLLAFRKQQKTSNATNNYPATTAISPLAAAGVPNSTNDPENSSSKGAASLKRGKLGSLQLFVQNLGPIENFSPSIIPTEEVHKIAILDLRLLNLDRNACNILV